MTDSRSISFDGSRLTIEDVCSLAACDARAELSTDPAFRARPLPGNEARTLIETLRQFYDADGTAFQIEEIAGGYQLLTRAAIHPWLLRLRRTGHDVPLTPATMETLAVIAYKQPIMRAEIEKIRGVQCADLIRVLMEKGLVRIAGRHDSLGRPQLYGTTKTFLEAFGLNALSDLPEVASLKNPG